MTTTSSEATPKRKTRTKSAIPAGRQKTKRAILIEMLSRKTGADADAISKKLGWQPHTTRAALSGLRKAGYVIFSEKPGNGKPAQYKITASPAE